MARLRPIINTFASGVIKQALTSRTDIQHYHDGLLIGENIDIQVEGGMKQRPGQVYRHEALATTCFAIPFVFDRENKYALLFTHLQMQVVKNGVLQTNLNASGNDFIVTPYTASQVKELDYTQAYNSMILFHEDQPQQLLFRDGSDTDWSLGPLTFDNVFQQDFDDALSPAPTTHDVQITFGGTWVTGERYVIELNDFETPTLHYSGSTADNTRRIRDALLKLPPTGFRQSSIVVTSISATIYRIRFSDDSADLYEDITGYSIDTSSNKITQTASTVPGVSRRENAFSGTRGFPRCGAFFGGGLWQDGYKNLPQRTSRSLVGDFFNLDVGKGFDDEAISFDLDTDQYNGIRYLHPGRHLVIFTHGGEFYYPQKPITPGDSVPDRQTRYGVGDAKPVEIDGAILFPTRNNRTIREFLFTQIEEAYNASSLTPISGEAVIAANIESMAGQDAFGSDEASRLFCTTADGLCASLNSKRDQDMAAWSRYNTPGAAGAYKQAISVDDQVYYLVQRTVDGTVKLYLEQRDETCRTDSCVTGTLAIPGKVITGLGHLEGQTVRVIGDGIVQESQTVTGAQITAERDLLDYEVGLDFNPDAKGTSLELDLGFGSSVGEVKSVVAVYVLVKDTIGLEVGLDVTSETGETMYRKESIPEWVIGETTLNTPPTPYSGLWKVPLSGSVEQGAMIRFTQSDPHPFHILGYVALLEIGED